MQQMSSLLSMAGTFETRSEFQVMLATVSVHVTLTPSP
jgi:hypothetical protein